MGHYLEVNKGRESKHKNVLLTTYPQLRSSLGKILLKWKFQVLICDESHNCKNEKSATAMSVLVLTAKYRLLITGNKRDLNFVWSSDV